MAGNKEIEDFEHNWTNEGRYSDIMKRNNDIRDSEKVGPQIYANAHLFWMMKQKDAEVESLKKGLEFVENELAGASATFSRDLKKHEKEMLREAIRGIEEEIKKAEAEKNATKPSGEVLGAVAKAIIGHAGGMLGLFGGAYFGIPVLVVVGIVVAIKETVEPLVEIHDLYDTSALDEKIKELNEQLDKLKKKLKEKYGYEHEKE